MDPSYLEALRSVTAVAQTHMSGDLLHLVLSNLREQEEVGGWGGLRYRRQTQTSAVCRERHQPVFGKHRSQRLAAEVGEQSSFTYTKLGCGN